MLHFLDCIKVTEMLKSLTDVFKVDAALEYLFKKTFHLFFGELFGYQFTS